MKKNQIIINDGSCDFKRCQPILPENVDETDINVLYDIYKRPPTISEVYHYSVVKFFENNPDVKINDHEKLAHVKNIMAYAHDFNIKISMHSCYNAYREKVFQRSFPQNHIHV